MGLSCFVDIYDSPHFKKGTREMNNEPVAWLEPEWGEYICPEIGFEIKITEDHPQDLGWIPLYAHQVKELTDEEISQVYKEVSEPFGEKRLYEIHSFARAILRKAQEK